MIFRIINRIKCSLEGHKTLVFVRNIYGDEINIRDGKRSCWRCAKCGTYKFKSALFKAAE